MSAIAYLRAVGFLLALVLSAGLASARAEIIAYVDENGRRIYVNVEDEELRVAVERGGASAAQHLLERRRGSMPGIEQHIRQAARENSVDPLLIHAIIQVESAWNPRARSRKGALGLMQLMPATGARFGVRDFFDPKQNVTGGVRYLRFLLDRFDNDPQLALAAYNAGENAVAAAGGVPPYRETREYLKRVNALYEFSRSHVPGTGSIYQVADEQGRTIYIND
ncbi:lytic transglycosylase domain-containing protein [Acidobacteriia bacterium AH_259_A11_L15]|nr:lytic transglycosylase domain-containing protein [Acidobacteriia bacterium AH_259_A11_L15]